VIFFAAEMANGEKLRSFFKAILTKILALLEKIFVNAAFKEQLFLVLERYDAAALELQLEDKIIAIVSRIITNLGIPLAGFLN